MPIIFVVDGHIGRVGLARDTLEQAGYEVECFVTAGALDLAAHELPDLFLIAANLPDGSGIDLCRRLRSSYSLSRTRIILMADTPEERYRAVVDSGADDVIIKSLDLIYHVRAAIHRPPSVALPVPFPREAEIAIDSSAMRIKVRGNEVSTTALEFHLIDYMARHRGKMLTRDALLDAVWGDLQFVAPRSVDACVGRIRRKIEPDPFRPSYLKTIRGVGYKLEAMAIWEETSKELCPCPSCTMSRARSRLPTREMRRRIAT